MPEEASTRIWIKDAPSKYQMRDITHFPDWGKLIVWDAFFNNLTSGTMVVATVAWLAGPTAFTWLLPVTMTVALLLVLTDLCLLVLDLGDPWRFYHSLRVMRFTSPLSVGVWGLCCYAGFLAFGTLFSWCIWGNQGDSSVLTFFLLSLSRLFTIMAFLAALVVICYKGVVFSCSSQPGLKDARWLTPFMVSDSLLMGLAINILICLPLAPRSISISLILPLVFLICARCITFGLLWQDVKHRAREVYANENRIVAAMVYGVGGILALILSFCGFFGLAAAAILMLCTGAVERFWFIGLAKPVNKN